MRHHYKIKSKENLSNEIALLYQLRQGLWYFMIGEFSRGILLKIFRHLQPTYNKIPENNHHILMTFFNFITNQHLVSLTIVKFYSVFKYHNCKNYFFSSFH